MPLQPNYTGFQKTYKAGKPQLVWTVLVGDLETPVSAMLKLAGERPFSFLLESVEGGAVRGRYSIIGFDPDIIWRASGPKAEINRDPVTDPENFAPLDEPTLTALRALLEESRIEIPEGVPPMSAGVFGYMSYDSIRLVEQLENINPDVLGVPDSVMIRPTMMVVFDAVKDEIWIVTPVYPKKRLTAKQAYANARSKIEDIIDALDTALPHQPDVKAEQLALPTPVSNTTPKEYMAMVRKAKKYISAGDIFQVVLSQRFSLPFTLPAISLYRALRRTNPSPYLFYLNFGSYSIVGSSPEILVRVAGDEITVRPIAGTRPRGKTAAEDAALSRELLGDPKECAEHLMLLDLGRNDVGRVAKTGTVEVTDSFFLEYYSQVMHIVSNVVGKLDKKHDAIDALMAGFPAGTVSGAPKVRAMEIIDELERDKRGPYAGCVGYFSADGDMDTCIVLRTAILKDGVLHVQAGAGLVADSVPKNEQAECINKAKALFKAAEEAVRFASQSSKRGKNTNRSLGGR